MPRVTRKKESPNGHALVALTVNGEPVEVSFAPHKTLLEVLREDLRLTGTKHGCELGECGTCAVLVDGEPVLSCLFLGLECAGRRIETVEGMALPAGLHPLQKAFADLGAAQCGYCTPGFLLTARALLAKNPRPSRGQVQEALAGNLCRCTGYVKIFEAVELAAAWMRGEAAEPPKESLYGRDFDESGLLPVCRPESKPSMTDAIGRRSPHASRLPPHARAHPRRRPALSQGGRGGEGLGPDQVRRRPVPAAHAPLQDPSLEARARPPPASGRVAGAGDARRRRGGHREGSADRVRHPARLSGRARAGAGPGPLRRRSGGGRRGARRGRRFRRPGRDRGRVRASRRRSARSRRRWSVPSRGSTSTETAATSTSSCPWSSAASRRDSRRPTASTRTSSSTRETRTCRSSSTPPSPTSARTAS